MADRAALLSAPIVPGEEAAGIALGTGSGNLETTWGKPTAVVSGDYDQWQYGPVIFWLSEGLIRRIGLYEGYQGKTGEGLHVGSTRLEVERAVGPLIGNRDNENWVPMLPPGGIAFDMHGEPGQEPVVTAIYVE
jgi:hypothetical protein